jgi:hypothetical protein
MPRPLQPGPKGERPEREVYSVRECTSVILVIKTLSQHTSSYSPANPNLACLGKLGSILKFECVV